MEECTPLPGTERQRPMKVSTPILTSADALYSVGSSSTLPPLLRGFPSLTLELNLSNSRTPP